MTFRNIFFIKLTIIMSLIIFSSCENKDSSLTSNTISKNDWTNTEAREKYKSVAIKICNTFSPLYLGLGIEVNTYYHYNPTDFARYVQVYKDIYDYIKTNTNCSSTKVFVTFQLERMKGIGTSVGYPGASQWSILNQFDGKLDLVVFTTYPEVEYTAPSSIPDNYFTSIISELPANLSSKKIAFTEMGWNSSVNLISGSNNTFQSQVDFITRFATITDTLKTTKIEFVSWAFMHDYKDCGSFDPFRTIGLRNTDGSQKDNTHSAWEQWINYKNFIGSTYKFGIGSVPRNFPGSNASDWLDMFQKVPSLATLLLAQTDWKDSISTAGEMPQLFIDMNNAFVYHQADEIYGISFFNLATGEAIINK